MTCAPMQVTYQNEPNDYLQYCRYRMASNPKAARGLSILFVLVFVPILAFFSLLVGVVEGTATGITIAVVGLVVGVIAERITYGRRGEFLAKATFERSLRDDPYWYRRITLTISPERVAWQTDLGEGSFLWPAIHHVVEDDGLAYFCVGKNSILWVVPNRAFATDQQYRQFVTAAMNWAGEDVIVADVVE